MPAFQLVRTPDEDGRQKLAFTWTPPSDAKIVHCAVFACRPFIPYTKIDGDPALAISNYDNCVLAREVIEPASGVFDLTNPALEYRPKDKGIQGCISSGVRRVSELAVGCWAYDTTSVVAATPLVQIVGRGMYNYQGVFAKACDATSAGKACFIGDTDRLGACRGEACLELCVDSTDCVPPDNVVVGEVADAGIDAFADTQDASDAASDADAGGDSSADAGPPPPPPTCIKEDSYIGWCVPAGDGGSK